MIKRILFPESVSNNYLGFKKIINFYHEIDKISNCDIVVDFINTYWFDANLCAVLGAIFIDLTKENNNIKIINLSKSIFEILSKNQFLQYFSNLAKDDTYTTTIKFKVFPKGSKLEFQGYLDSELLPKLSDVHMSNDFKNMLCSNLDEVYQNARYHSDAKHIVCCGQWFPQKHNVKFTIVNLGKSIYSNVAEIIPDIKPEEAIEWATQYGNSTKKNGILGGLGLNDLKEFIRKNNGKMHIISNKGYWSMAHSKMNINHFENDFPGTIVNLEINLDDSNIYLSQKEEEMFLKLYNILNLD